MPTEDVPSLPSTPEIDGVRIVALEPHPDDRGSFTELFRSSWLPAGSVPVQANLSSSAAGVLRGLHFHRRQWDYWIPLAGAATVALADLRIGSPSESATSTLELSADEPRAIFIPPGVAHGFFARTAFSMVYLVDAEFDPGDDLAVSWSDPELAIAWPADDPVLSARDRAAPALADIRRDLPIYHPLVG